MYSAKNAQMNYSFQFYNRHLEFSKWKWKYYFTIKFSRPSINIVSLLFSDWLERSVSNQILHLHGTSGRSKTATAEKHYENIMQMESEFQTFSKLQCLFSKSVNN